MLNNYMCKKKKVIAYFVETKDKDLFIENETFVKYFPKIKVFTYILDDYVKNNIPKIMEKLEKKYCVRKYILSLFSSSIKNYFMPSIEKYHKSTFIAVQSTAVDLRVNSPKNLFFSLETDDAFIDKWITFSQLLAGTNILLSDCSDDIYIQGIIKLVENTGQIVICMNDMNTPENQELLLNANLIGCSTLNFENLLTMCSNIPREYDRYIATIDFGATTNEQLTKLNNAIPPNTLFFGTGVPSTMMTLSLDNPWVNSIKLEKSEFTYSYAVCIYVILNSIHCWDKLLIKSNLIKNDKYYVFGLCYFENKKNVN